MDKKLTIQIVGWNSADCLREGLELLKQYPKDVTIRYIDNNSQDRSVEIVKEILPTADTICLKSNIGFGAAHNIGIKKCETEFIMLHNPDLVLNLNSIPKILATFDDKRIGAVQGKILKSKNSGQPNIIDSTGIEMTLALNGGERGEGEIDTGQYDTAKEVAAVTGAAGCYRLAALLAVHDVNGDIFDEDFFAYKEDVDLGWRLRQAGWVCKYIPVLQGWHQRGFGKIKAEKRNGKFSTFVRKLRDRRTRWSLRNWVWMMLKNATVKDAIKHEFFVDLRLAMFMVISAVYWPLMGTWAEVVRGIPMIMKKRARAAQKLNSIADKKAND